MGETDGMEVLVRRIRAEEGALLRSVRLAALADAPSAFGSSYAAEVDQPDDFWTDRAMLGAAGERSVTFFAIADAIADADPMADSVAGESVVGLVSAYRPDPARLTVELVSMWVAPAHRRAGVAAALVAAVVSWARDADMASVELWVTRGNDGAVRLYEAAGFRLTGDHQPLPSDPCKDELRMRLPLA